MNLLKKFKDRKWRSGRSRDEIRKEGVDSPTSFKHDLGDFPNSYVPDAPMPDWMNRIYSHKRKIGLTLAGLVMAGGLAFGGYKANQDPEIKYYSKSLVRNVINSLESSFSTDPYSSLPPQGVLDKTGEINLVDSNEDKVFFSSHSASFYLISDGLVNNNRLDLLVIDKKDLNSVEVYCFKDNYLYSINYLKKNSEQLIHNRMGRNTPFEDLRKILNSHSNLNESFLTSPSGAVTKSYVDFDDKVKVAQDRSKRSLDLYLSAIKR